MKASKVAEIITAVGLSFEALVMRTIIQEQPLIEIYPGCDRQGFDVENGVELSFWAETQRLESFFITLISTMPLTQKYEGELPVPFAHEMTQVDVHKIFGVPVEFKGPIKMPEPVGWTGGWESYLLDQDVYPGKKVQFQYTADMRVDTLVFTLIDKGRK